MLRRGRKYSKNSHVEKRTVVSKMRSVPNISRKEGRKEGRERRRKNKGSEEKESEGLRKKRKYLKLFTKGRLFFF